ncbi:N-acetyltransferase [Brevundimonas basaltis]|uniref:Putative N-acetyltransferase YhbS n=1 Tax=Brevundimonas basaltis TaxID=472166 RepID=A0A7W8I0U6_9CAUL|nr:N-acetyltransferase [Brevundimonas basaltis]MBB5292472.1 putative N-acetyltransferase YhbS [Brevundimonas basaltis]
MSATPILSTVPHIEVETAADAAAVEALVLAAFGPGRFAKTAERLRERAAVAAGFVAREGGVLLGSVRLWSITVGGTPALFLGPIAVAADNRRAGLGAELVQACLARAAETGQGVLLVGDAPYFGRFGFVVAPEVRLTGPVDPRRVLWRGEGLPAGLVLPA